VRDRYETRFSDHIGDQTNNELFVRSVSLMRRPLLISSRLSSPVICRPRRAEVKLRPASQLTDTLQSEVATYTAVLSILNRENRSLEKLIEALKSPWNPGFSPFLDSHFASRISALSGRLNECFTGLTALDQEARSTRVIHGGIMEDKCEKTQMLILNDRLVDSALFQEQQILIAKLKLRLFHDHRDLCRAKQQLVSVRENAPIQEVDGGQKERIQILKNAIEHERWRIALLNSEHADLHLAAMIIQKTWRGYAHRKHNPTLPEPPVRVPPPVPAEEPTKPAEVTEVTEVTPTVPKIEIKAAVPHMDKVDSSDEYYSYADSDSQGKESAPSSEGAAPEPPELPEDEEASEAELGEEELAEEEIAEEEEEKHEDAGDDTLFEVTGVAQPDGGDLDPLDND
jgi:hypothetical protein